MSPAIYFLYLMFVLHATAFCVGAILGVLWPGRWWSLLLFASGLALACLVGLVVWRIDANVHRLEYYFTSLDRVAEFLLAVFLCFVGVLSALGGYLLKVWLRSRKIPPILTVPPVLPANA